jgi:hypothetical protein
MQLRRAVCLSVGMFPNYWPHSGKIKLYINKFSHLENSFMYDSFISFQFT